MAGSENRPAETHPENIRPTITAPESLSMQVFRLGILYSFLAVALGVCLLIWQEKAVAISYIAASSALVLYGLWKACRYFFLTPDEAQEKQLLATGLLLLTLGFLLLAYRLDTPGVWRIRIMGMVMVFSAATRIEAAADLKRIGYKRWLVVLVVALTEAVLGVLTLVGVFADPALVIVLGCVLTVEGLTDGWCRLATRSVLRAREKAAREAANAPAPAAPAAPAPAAAPAPEPAPAPAPAPAPEPPAAPARVPVFGHATAEDPFKTAEKKTDPAD